MTEQLKVLIVEDSPSQALKFKFGLESVNCLVTWAETGLGGLALAQQDTFDLIVLDIALPDISGFTVCKRLKADPALAHIPVIMLTVKDTAEDVLNGLEAGALDYIPKDAFAEPVLLETVKHMRRQKQAAIA